MSATKWQSCGSAEKPLQLRGHALPLPAAHDAYWRAVCAAARSEIREPNAGIGRITAFSFSAQANGRARRDRFGNRPGDRWQDRGEHSSLRLEWVPGTTSSRRLGGAVPAPHGAAKRRSPARARRPQVFFPARAVSSAFLLPVQGREGIGLSSRWLIARRYRHEHWLLSSPRTTSISSSASSGTQATEVGYGSRNQ